MGGVCACVVKGSQHFVERMMLTQSTDQQCLCLCHVLLVPALCLSFSSGQCGLWMDEYLHRGSSSPCQTFDNECLATQTDFAILGVEVWCLVS